MSDITDLDAVAGRAAVAYATAHGTEGADDGRPTCVVTGANVPALVAEVRKLRAALGRILAEDDATQEEWAAAPEAEVWYQAIARAALPAPEHLRTDTT